MMNEPQHRSQPSQWTADKVELLLQVRFARSPQLSDGPREPKPRRGSSAVLGIALATLTLAAWPLLNSSTEPVPGNAVARWVGDVSESAEAVDIAANEASSEEELPAEESAVERTAELPTESDVPETTEPATEST